MIKVYNAKNKPLGFLNDVFDLKITKEIGGMEEMHFYVPVDSPESKLLQLEGYVVPEGEQIFVVRELNVHGKDIEVYCVIAVENLYGYCWAELSRKGISLVEAFEYTLQYTGWKFVNRSSAPARTRDIYIQNQTVWEALKVLCEVYFVEMTIDTWTHTITVYDQIGANNGTYFISDTNLINFRKDTSTHKLITRLIPLGKDGLTIEKVNGGKNYIDNNTYSDKLLYGLWVQTAYTNPQQLKEDATQWLAEYAKPFVTYNVDIIDLYRMDGNSNFRFDLGDTVTLIDKLTEEKAVQRVVKMVTYPHDPRKNSIELSNKGKTFQDYFKMIQLMNNLASHFIQTNGSSTGTGDINVDKTPPSGSINGGHIQEGVINNGHLSVDSVTTDKIVANSITTDKLQANSITADKISANSISTDKLQANSVTADKIDANSINSNHIQAGSINAGHIQTVTIDASHIKSNSIEANHIKAGAIESKHIQSESITTDKLSAKCITTEKLDANIINANHIQSNTITAEHIQTGTITAGSGIIAEGAIGSAEISEIDANKLKAGTIDTSRITISGANSNLKISGNRLQVFDGIGTNQVERVSLGDVNGDGTIYGFRVRGADGETVLLDENGVTKEGITDGSITNEKIAGDANIDAGKINIHSVVTKINEGSTQIQGNRIDIDNKNLTVAIDDIQNTQDEHRTTLEKHSADIKANTDQIALKVSTLVYEKDKEGNISKFEDIESQIQINKDAINSKVSNVTYNADKQALEGSISEVSQKADVISSKVTNLDGKYTELKQTVEGIDVTGKVSFSDLSTVGKTTINGANITTGTLDTNKVNIKGSTTKKIVISNDNYCVYDGAETDVNRKVFLGFRTSTTTNIPSVMLGYNGINPEVDGAVVAGGTYTTFSHYPNTNNPESVNMSYGALAFKYGANYNQFSTLNMYQNGEVDIKAGGDIYFRPNLRARNNPSMIVGDSGINVRLPLNVASTVYANGNIATDGKLTSNNLYVSEDATISGALTVANKAIYGMGNIALMRGNIYLPQGGGNTTADYLKIGGGFMAGVSSGNFHFLTAGGVASRLYASNVTSSYSLEPAVKASSCSVFDEINSVNVVDTSEGFRLANNSVRLANTENTSNAVYTTYNEKTEQVEFNIDYTTAISTLWKAVQELKAEVDSLKEENMQLRAELIQ